MRVKQIWDVVPLPAKAKLFWERLTFSRLTTAYVLFSIINFTIQIALQIHTFTINANAATLLYSIIVQGDATNSSFPVATDTDIRMCGYVPSSLNTDECTVVWDGTPAPPGRNGALAALNLAVNAPESVLSTTLASTVSIPSISAPASSSTSNPVSTKNVVVTVTELVVAPSSTSRAAPTPTATLTGLDNTIVILNSNRKRVAPQAKVRIFAGSETRQVNITGLGYNNYPLTLDGSCMWSLNWPASILDNTKREDIVFIAYQFWVLGMSMVALLNESIPHILASLLTHVLSTAWSSYQIYHTARFRKNFNEMITEGACNGAPSLLPTYWQDRASAEIPTLALNIVALLVSIVLTWKLMKLFGWQTFKRVGASLTINRVYKLVLVFSITLQLALFFMGVAVSLFIDQLFNGWAGQLAWYSLLYKVMFIFVGVMLFPWLTLGWISVRRELRIGMFIFLLLSVLYLAGYGVMFLSTTFRWTFVNWQFFCIMSLVSVFLALLSFILGVVCRCNFGKGLLRYLTAQESLPGDDFVPITRGEDMEKVAFPSNEKPVPTFSVTFGSGSEVPVPSQMFKQSPQMGPRFFNQNAEPFDARPNSSNTSPITPPMAALTRTSSSNSASSYQSSNTALPNKRDSGRSLGSLNSYYDYSAGDSNHARRDSEGTPAQSMSKRWVIE
ncbi:hypothetical protein C8J57DRAFT_1041078 [Mycena rebaudengoi]|nr:hypothetical protein C8J57DRAFT_1041078 [Mycena rebaudengoi]